MCYSLPILPLELSEEILPLTLGEIYAMEVTQLKMPRKKSNCGSQRYIGVIKLTSCSVLKLFMLLFFHNIHNYLPYHIN